MFRVSLHPSLGVLKTVTAASGTSHNIGTATSLQRGQPFVATYVLPKIIGLPVYVTQFLLYNPTTTVCSRNVCPLAT